MAYTKTYVPSRYFCIQSICDKMLELKPKESFELEHPTEKDRRKVKGLIYDWMHHMGVGNDYTISNEQEFRVRVERDEKPKFSLTESVAVEATGESGGSKAPS